MDLRRKKVRLSEEDIMAMLRLPRGTRIAAVRGRFDPPSVEVLMQRDDWPEIPPDSEAPLMSSFRQMIDDRLVLWFPELSRDGEPAAPQFSTEYEWRAPSEYSKEGTRVVVSDDRQDVIALLETEGGHVRQRLVSDWDALEEDGDQ